MKKLVIASIAILLTMGLAEARFFGRRGNCNGCPTRRSCAPACETECVAPVPPKCCKTIRVPQTIMVDKTVEVPARKVVIPQCDRVEYVKQPCKYRRIPQPSIPQPDIIEEVEQPCLVKHIPQAPLIRYECPSDCDAS